MQMTITILDWSVNNALARASHHPHAIPLLHPCPRLAFQPFVVLLMRNQIVEDAFLKTAIDTREHVEGLAK
jgi:hypothetical protein